MPSRLSMSRNSWLPGCCMLCLVSFAACAQPDSDDQPMMSLDGVLQGYLTALGGQTALDQIQTVRIRGKLFAQDGNPTPYNIDFIPPDNRMRMDFALQGIPGTLAYDGEHAWQLPPLLVADTPIRLNAEAGAGARQQADFYGALIQPEAKGHLLELIGATTRDNRSAWEIRVTKADGNREHWFLDLDSYLPFRVEATNTLAAQADPRQNNRVQSSIIHYADHRPVEITGSQPAASLMWPFSVRIEYRQQPGQLNQIESMQINLPLDAGRFDVPDNARAEPVSNSRTVQG